MQPFISMPTTTPAAKATAMNDAVEMNTTIATAALRTVNHSSTLRGVPLGGQGAE